MRGLVGAVLLWVGCAAEPTLARISLTSAASSTPKEMALTASVFGPAGAIRLRVAIPPPSLVPGTLVLVLPDVDQTLRVVVYGAGASFGGVQIVARKHT